MALSLQQSANLDWLSPNEAAAEPHDMPGSELRHSESWQAVLDGLLRPVIHDLKMPLAAEQKAIELVRKGIGDVSGEMADLLVSMQLNNRDLIALVESLLEMTEGLANSEMRRSNSVCLQGLLTEIRSRLEPLIRERKIVIIEEIPADLPPASIHPGHMRRVLLNLVGNAIQHTVPGTTIRIVAEWRKDHIGLEIRDNGRLVRQGGMLSETRLPKGSGLGLPICRMLLEGSGGSIHRDHTCTEGACFVITLPPAQFGKGLLCKR
jgi:signal transduction histidine kinase